MLAKDNILQYDTTQWNENFVFFCVVV